MKVPDVAATVMAYTPGCVPVVVVAVAFLPHAGNRLTVPSKTTSAAPETQRRREVPAPRKATPHSGNHNAYQNVGVECILAVAVGAVVVIVITEVALPLVLGMVLIVDGVKVQVAPASTTGVVGWVHLSAILAGNCTGVTPGGVCGVSVTVYLAVFPAATDTLAGATAVVK